MADCKSSSVRVAQSTLNPYRGEVSPAGDNHLDAVITDPNETKMTPCSASSSH